MALATVGVILFGVNVGVIVVVLLLDKGVCTWVKKLLSRVVYWCVIVGRGFERGWFVWCRLLEDFVARLILLNSYVVIDL